MTHIIGLDPGPYRSALVVYDGSAVIEHHALNNNTMLDWLTCNMLADVTRVLIIEQIAAMGMAVGAEVFLTAFWDGRFTQAWEYSSRMCAHLKRHEVKMHLCGTMRAKDPNIRAALIDKFGGQQWAIGTKKQSGPLYGLHGDEWSALAVACTWFDLHVNKTNEVQQSV